ncbi:MAG: dihydrolipoamide acetyltransferase family protein, partial [Brevundimonas sp.]
MGRFVFKLPDVGEGTAEAELAAWHVKVGDRVVEDQIVAEIMTDKATVEITAPVAGVIAELHGAPGQMLAVRSPLVEFVVEGEGNAEPFSLSLDGRGAGGEGDTVSKESAPAEAAPVETARPAPQPAAGVTPTPTPPPSRGRGSDAAPAIARDPNQKPLASPAVRRRARELGVELQFVTGSGPAGRIEHGDLDAFLAGGSRTAPAAGGSLAFARADGTTEVKIIGLRRKIAEKMAESVRRIPHITYVEEIDVTALEELRAHLNAQNKGTDRPKLNLLPFLARAIIVALSDQQQINSHYDDEAGVLTQHAPVHLGIAAQTPNGLMVPVVRHAEARDVYDTANEIARVSGAAKSGKAAKDELSGSTITITSLGTLGGVVHTPIINHPEVAIVGPNKIQERVVVKDG